MPAPTLLGPQRKLEWDPLTNSWAPTQRTDEDYQKTFAENIKRGGFPVFGATKATPDPQPFEGMATGDPWARPSLQALMEQNDPNSEINKLQKGRKTAGGRVL
jgi:hypothetical protein